MKVAKYVKNYVVGANLHLTASGFIDGDKSVFSQSFVSEKFPSAKFSFYCNNTTDIKIVGFDPERLTITDIDKNILEDFTSIYDVDGKSEALVVVTPSSNSWGGRTLALKLYIMPIYVFKTEYGLKACPGQESLISWDRGDYLDSLCLPVSQFPTLGAYKMFFGFHLSVFYSSLDEYRYNFSSSIIKTASTMPFNSLIMFR